MRNTLLIAIATILLGSCQMQDVENTISLNGTWNFLASNEIEETEILSGNVEWDTLPVPSNWDTRERYSEYVGKGYYQREFNVPKNWNGKQVRISFGAVYQTSKVWVNGKLLGTHIGGYTPFEYNITDIVEFGKANTVLVMADNTYKRGAWWAWGGISRDVNLVCNEDVRLVYQHIEAIPDFEKELINFRLKYKIENNSNDSFSGVINSSVANSIEEFAKFEISGNETIVEEISFQANLSEYKLWDVNQPNLYTLKSELFINDKVYDSASDKFGIRKIEAIGEQLFLNNKPIRLNGLNRVHDHPAYGNTEPDHLVIADMQDIRSLGADFSRLMHAPLSKNILEFCDSVGFLLIEEIPVWGDDDPQTFKDNPQTKTWLNELITRDYNHPSVIGWSVGNELRENDSIAPWGKKKLTSDQFEYINSMLDHIETIDTTRLKTYVGLTTYQAGTMENEPYDKLDLICINSYSNGPWCAEETNKKFPGKPIFLSEIGILQIGPAPEGELSEKLVNQLIGLRDLPYVVGTSLWCYNDYRSNYKGTPDSGFREWGVVDERRNRKAAYEQIKEIYGYETVSNE